MPLILRFMRDDEVVLLWLLRVASLLHPKTNEGLPRPSDCA